MIEIWTDGACDKLGNAGWGYVALDSGRILEASGSMAGSTSQRAELTALLFALQHATSAGHMDFIIHSDSAYLVNCFVDRWFVNWRLRGWRTSADKPVKNKDLWGQLITIVERLEDERGSIRFVKVKGHVGNTYNEQADRLAVAARLSLL